VKLAILLVFVASFVGCGEKPQPAAPVTPQSKLPANAGGQQLSHP